MSKQQLITGIAVAVAIAVVAYFFFFMNNGSTPGSSNSQNAPQGAVNSQTSSTAPASSSDSVVIQDVKTGTGAVAAAGDSVKVTYVGKLQDGTVFDQSSDHGGSFSFTLGSGQVIPGWDQGIAGMKVGGERVLVIPPSLGYGSKTVGPIPANSTLVFDVTLLAVTPSSGQ